MIRTFSFAATLTVVAASAVPAAAATWGIGVGVDFGQPVYVGPPPVLYDPPVVYEGTAPLGYYQGQPVAVAPDGRPVFHMESADDVLDDLARAGYRELGPMHMRGHFYSLNAVEPNGDLVQLDISIFTGEIAQRTVLQPRYRAAPPPVPAPPPMAVAATPTPIPPPPASATPPSTLGDRLTPPPAEQDPLVVY